MRKITPYWRLMFLPFAVASFWTAHVCVTQFETTRREIMLFTVLAIVFIVAPWLLRQARVRRDG
jgi:hypothetical protein